MMTTQFLNSKKSHFDQLYERIINALDIAASLNKTIVALQKQVAENHVKIRELGGGFSYYPNDINIKTQMIKIQNLNVDTSHEIETITKQRTANTEHLNQLISVMELLDKKDSKTESKGAQDNKRICF